VSHCLKKQNLLLTISGDVGTEAANSTLNKKATGEVKGNTSTHRKDFNEYDVDK